MNGASRPVGTDCAVLSALEIGRHPRGLRRGRAGRGAGELTPMPLVLRAALFNDPDWLFEVRQDGSNYRANE